MKDLLLFLALFASSITFGQYHPSIHEQQLNEYSAFGNSEASFYESMPVEKIAFPKSNCNLNRIVYGWHPYWIGSAYQNYQWDLLSHFSFFSYEVDPTNGQAITTHGWSTSAAVDSALASGTKVTLCVTLFSDHATFFSSSTSQQTLITSLINLVSSRGAHGVNIDFEGLPNSQATNFANFMVNLSNQMHTAIPGSEVSTVLYAVDWNGVFDFSIMEPHVDHYIIMGYGYYYSGSSTAGPTGPLYHFGSTYNFTLSRSITYYLDIGCPKDKLVLGLPNYGYEWPTSNQNWGSSTTGSGTARTFAYVMNNSSGNYSSINESWDADSYTNRFVFNDNGDRQCLISLDSSWRKRLEHVLTTDIAGIAIWALGYDNGHPQLWSAMEDYLTDCYSTPCSGTIHDFGGPLNNYYNDEDYTWTIAPPNATNINVDFTAFNVEANYDYLYIYDGPDNTAPQIVGSPFSGTSSPGSFTTSGGAVTFRFTSDGATVAPGFIATYTCSSLAPPSAGFSTSGLSICAGDSIQLINTSSNADTYNWSTSSGGLSSNSTENPYLFPSSSGTYTVTLEVDNASGSDVISQDLAITVYQPPVANASVNSTNLVLPSAIAFFTNSSINAGAYYWDFGDGNFSSDESPWHEYTSAGTYTAMLIVSNGACESDTITFTINVGSAGIDELANELTIFPNPFSDQIDIQLGTQAEFRLFDDQGRETTFDLNETGNGYSLTKIQAAAGTYLLEITVDNRVRYQKVIKQ